MSCIKYKGGKIIPTVLLLTSGKRQIPVHSRDAYGELWCW